MDDTTHWNWRPAVSKTRSRDREADRLLAAVKSLPVGLVVVPGGGGPVQANACARQLLGETALETLLLPSEVRIPDRTAPHVAVLERPGRAALRLTARPITSGGAVMLVESLAAGPSGSQAEAQYLSLFDNAICGIYRDRLDGTPVRANLALANLNGYTSESEYLAAVTASPGNWYVEPARSALFQKMLHSENGVRDLVSEVYRHKTRERFWITENAWYVRDASGVPIFIEGTIQDATERVNGMAMIERQANVDALTGAASRFRFLNHLAELTGLAAAECVLFSIDLDNFKEVNDLLGHGAGDSVLRAVASRLQAMAPDNSLVARLGGDEFALLVSGRHCHMDADMIAARIVRSLREPVEIDGHNAQIGASVGVAVYPAQASNAEELLTHADLALYRVKADGRNGFRLFDHNLKLRLQRRKLLEAELREAIAADELELYYQPIVDARTASVTSLEALMRWNHRRRGLLPPSEFIQVAEDAGLMTELGNWAIRRACLQAAALPSHIAVAVNVSPNQFRSSGIVDAVRSALRETGLSASRLTLEVTETVILSSEAKAAEVIEELQRLGVRLALDDFGTGYSSLSYLQRYAFSKVKIDRSFVAGIERTPANLAIIRAIIGLAREIGIEVVAEGIETLEQAETLKAEGCTFLQGYHFGRPRPFTDVAANLAIANLKDLRRPAWPDLRVGPQERTVHNPL